MDALCGVGAGLCHVLCRHALHHTPLPRWRGSQRMEKHCPWRPFPRSVFSSRCNGCLEFPPMPRLDLRSDDQQCALLHKAFGFLVVVNGQQDGVVPGLPHKRGKLAAGEWHGIRFVPLEGEHDNPIVWNLDAAFDLVPDGSSAAMTAMLCEERLIDSDAYVTFDKFRAWLVGFRSILVMEEKRYSFEISILSVESLCSRHCVAVHSAQTTRRLA
mmetsp:Transcript_35047/g.70820  ORF Transcript_35047/g.70820 Transcript_35047/m.70820 type:complete len:214 (+) Transcript_35047:95-736(+)